LGILDKKQIETKLIW